jgi:hypothetical protein
MHTCTESPGFGGISNTAGGVPDVAVSMLLKSVCPFVVLWIYSLMIHQTNDLSLEFK